MWGSLVQETPPWHCESLFVLLTLATQREARVPTHHEGFRSGTLARRSVGNNGRQRPSSSDCWNAKMKARCLTPITRTALYACDGWTRGAMRTFIGKRTVLSRTRSQILVNQSFEPVSHLWRSGSACDACVGVAEKSAFDSLVPLYPLVPWRTPPAASTLHNATTVWRNEDGQRQALGRNKTPSKGMPLFIKGN